MNPRTWFSEKRELKKREFEDHLPIFKRQIDRTDHLRSQLGVLSPTVQRQHEELHRYRSFGVMDANFEIASLHSRIEGIKAELDHLQPLKESVDLQQREPLAEWRALFARKTVVANDIRRAEEFERQLTNARSGLERNRIHEACEVGVGDAKPSQVIRARRRELESIERNQRKLEERLQSFAARATRVIRMLVFDGNNLCYQQQTFIGLEALRVAALQLARDHPVLIVFDATIRPLLRKLDREIAALFGDPIRVHVVASRKKADETLLDSAAAEDAFVVSNDRFADFPDKPAVRD